MTAKAFSSFLTRLYFFLAKPRLVLGFGIAYFVSQIIIVKILGPFAHDLLTLQTAFSVETFRDIFTAWGPEGLLSFKTHFYPDSLHPFLYALFLGSALAALTKDRKGAPSQKILALFSIPFGAALCDIFENILHIIIALNPDNITLTLVLPATFFAIVKWLLAGVSIIVILGFYAAYWMKQRKKASF